MRMRIKYNAIKYELDAIYDHITEGICIRSKCDQYEHSEKSAEFFLDLKEERGAQNTIKKLIVDDKETTDQTHILEFIKESYETLLKNASKNLEQKLKVFFTGFNLFTTDHER